jgi:hypothetical protein
MEPEENKESGNKNKTSLMDVVLFLGIMAIFAAAFVWQAADDLRDIHDDLVVQNEQAIGEKMNYWSQANVAGQELEAVWAVYNTQLPHESSVFQNASKAHSDYGNAMREGNPEKAVNAALQFNSLTLTEAYPVLGSEKLAEQTQLELKDSVSKMNDSFVRWTKTIEKYNGDRNKVMGRIAVYVWGSLLPGGTDLPRRISYYEFKQEELNVTKTLEKK